MYADEPDKHATSSLEENLKKALTELILLFLLQQKDYFISELTAAIKQRSQGALSIVFPYSAIYRLQQSGYIIESEKRSAPDGRRRQYFKITAKGQLHLQQLIKTYEQFSKGVADILTEGEEKA